MALEFDDATVQAFMDLFDGRKDVWGSVEGLSNKQVVTKAHYLRHLEGKESLGIYMLMDDATCRFFAIDIDEKDIEKPLAIRKEFAALGINSYMAFSRSKGYHVYCFADKESFAAVDARRLCHGILSKLEISAECFPKQDKLDEITPYGNYINLPGFGSSRMFFTTGKTNMPIADAVKRIKRVPVAKIKAATKSLPVLPAPIILPPTQKRKGRPRKSNNAPCIDAILKGVSQPGRDEAAFALARHYLDQGYSEPEVLQVLQRWDEKNKPPLNDPKVLVTKVKSAGKGYAFGCGSIQDNPNLSSFCCGEENCSWLKALNEIKKKKGLIREQVFYETETHLYEQVTQDGVHFFAAYEKETQKVTYVKTIDFPNVSIVPVQGEETSQYVIRFPSGAMDYGDTLKLKNEVRDHIKYYVDLDEQDLEYCSWYVVGTWVYDKLSTVAYLRFLGYTGVGKSRALDVIGQLCFRPLMMAGAVTPAPIYREIRKFRGTIILEEADFRETTEKSEVVTILNCGIERNRAVLRCSGDDNNVIEVLPTFGPKVFATRSEFDDKALESRCYTCTMRETMREEIPFDLHIDIDYDRWSMELRNKLLLWRFHNYDSIAQKIKPPDFGPVEPRLKQMGLPLAIPFMHMPEVMDDFRSFLLKRQKQIIQEREESDVGLIVRALFEVARDNNKWVSAGKVANHISNEIYTITPQKVSRVFKSLAIKKTPTKLRQPGESTPHYFIIWDIPLMKNLLKRYMVEHEEFDELFKIDMEV